MKPDDILKEVLSDPNLITVLKISEVDVEAARMDITSPDTTIEMIKAVIRGEYNGTSTQQIFNEIKKIKGI